jgi:hypothetical protein
MPTCPQCLSRLAPGVSCEQHFHQLLIWESEYPELTLPVHHLMVLCYHLQHPGLYSPQGLEYGKALLKDFVKNGKSPQEVRKTSRVEVDSGNRNWKITGTPESRGSYPQAMNWQSTISEIVAGGVENYIPNVKAWAQGTYNTLFSDQ